MEFLGKLLAKSTQVGL